MKRLLILEDGTVFEGTTFGAEITVAGEIVMTSSMTGYQEIITDPSYHGQIIAFTNPSIGNTGVNRDDYESIAPICKGIVVQEVSEYFNGRRESLTLDQYLKHQGIPGIKNVDMRMLRRKLREKGTMKASIVNPDDEFQHSYDQLRATVLPGNQVASVSTMKAYPSPGTGMIVVVIDMGVKHSILRELSKRKCNVIVLPYNVEAKQVLALQPDGILLSNGPGNPNLLNGTIEMVREVEKKVPLFGIGLGHQIFCLANGAKVRKMLDGHHGSNYPVEEVATGRVWSTAQNHNYVVEKTSLAGSDLILTYSELNDRSVEGVQHKKVPGFSVQFEPEAAPGPQESLEIFDAFIELMDAEKEKRNVLRENA
ncbi:carbamoyl phosphate synthase small subunit [Enterococcus hirae]|nr:carbamoyl phosphate synthase small subunit [Enterococcaceae bacterium]MCI1918903.1 carbamoyl phosphate synthase small subunit [Enterococcaceae bacterium]MDM8213103.1 carbamoyl phosphate synthase small subunit [Enterococcus hirae]